MRIQRLIKTFLVLCCVGYCAKSKAQESEFNISVADKTEETGLLEKGDWQIEGGFLFNDFEQGPSSEIGQLFIRHSISDGVELRLLVEDGKGRDRYISETVQATYPLALGAKVKLLEHHPVLPDMTFVGYLNLPFTAHNKSQTRHWSPMMFIAFEHQLNDRWSVDYNGGAQQEAFGSSWSGIFNGSVHYKILEQFELFTEYFAQYQPGELPQHNIGGGGTFAFNDHFAIYLAGGSTVNNEEGNHFFSVGLAVKFD